MPVYAKLSEIQELHLASDASTGMILASSQPYASSYALVGKYNSVLSRLESVTLLTPNKVRAEELSNVYRTTAIKQYTSRGKVMYGFQIQNPIKIPDQLQGVFR